MHGTKPRCSGCRSITVLSTASFACVSCYYSPPIASIIHTDLLHGPSTCRRAMQFSDTLDSYIVFLPTHYILPLSSTTNLRTSTMFPANTIRLASVLAAFNFASDRSAYIHRHVHRQSELCTSLFPHPRTMFPTKSAFFGALSTSVYGTSTSSSMANAFPTLSHSTIGAPWLLALNTTV